MRLVYDLYIIIFKVIGERSKQRPFKAWILRYAIKNINELKKIGIVKFINDCAILLSSSIKINKRFLLKDF